MVPVGKYQFLTQNTISSYEMKAVLFAHSYEFVEGKGEEE